jgi:hypothetical protein
MRDLSRFTTDTMGAVETQQLRRANLELEPEFELVPCKSLMLDPWYLDNCCFSRRTWPMPAILPGAMVT